MKSIILSVLTLIVSVCKAQTVIGPSVISWGGSVGYGFNPKEETYLWTTWINYEFNRTKKISPLMGLQMITWNTPSVVNRYFIPQFQMGLVTKSGYVIYYGFPTYEKLHSVGFGFYTGYQQYRIEYYKEKQAITFGCGFIIK